MSEAVKKIFDEISGRYDFLNRVLSFNIDRSWRKKAVKLIQSTAPHPVVLDICAGTFDFTLEVLKQYPQAKIHAGDFSEGMLKAGHAKIAHAVAGGSVIPEVADALALPYANDYFDFLVCGFGYRNVSDKTKCLTEFHRVLKKNGQAVVLEFFRPTSWLTKLFHTTYAQGVIPTVGGWLSGNRGAYAYLRDSIQGFLTQDEFCALAEKNGFKVKTLMTHSGGVATSVCLTKIA